MKSVNFVILGSDELANELGKKGTTTDLTLYDKKESDIIRTWVAPNGFPDKIQPLFQAINLAEYVILQVNRLDRFTGEQIIALDHLNKTKGILSYSFEVDENTLESAIKETVVGNYQRIPSDKIREEANKLEPVTTNGQDTVLIDHCFDVKGVGTVVLGKVLSGRIKQYDSMIHHPSKTEVVIKSIQMHDDPVDEAPNPARVGLALKGVKPEDVSRGDILCKEELQIAQKLDLDFEKNQYYKVDIKQDQICQVNLGLQIKSAKIESLNPLRLIFDKPLVLIQKECVLLKPESPKIRIMGRGKITGNS